MPAALLHWRRHERAHIACRAIEISLHRKSRLLEIAFSDGFRFNHPCEYLRVLSSGVQGLDEPVQGKDGVVIAHLEPWGSAALRLEFSDGQVCRGRNDSELRGAGLWQTPPPDSQAKLPEP